MRLLPGSVAARAETLGDCGAGQARQLPETADAEFLELLVLFTVDRQERKRKRGQEITRLWIRHDHDLAGPGHAGCRERREPALRRADVGVPAGAHGGECPPERRLHAPVQALDATRIARQARESELASARIEHEWRAGQVRAREHELAGLSARLTSLEQLDAARAGFGLHRPAHGAGRPARSARHAAHDRGAARRGVGRRQLQGEPAGRRARRAAGRAQRRRLRR